MLRLVPVLVFVLMLEWKRNLNRTGRLFRKSPLASSNVK